MQFYAKTFVSVSNPGARMYETGGVLFLSSFAVMGLMKIMKVPIAYGLYSLILTGAGIILLIVGRIVSKGNMFAIGLSDNDLVISEDGIQTAGNSFPVNEISDLHFWIEGYDGMVGPTFKAYRNFRNQARLSGADNKIHFRVDGKKHLYQFYLPNQESMNLLGQLFRSFYEQGVSFHECNRGGTTFLFQQVRSKSELTELKSKYGYR